MKDFYKKLQNLLISWKRAFLLTCLYWNTLTAKLPKNGLSSASVQRRTKRKLVLRRKGRIISMRFSERTQEHDSGDWNSKKKRITATTSTFNLSWKWLNLKLPLKLPALKWWTSAKHWKNFDTKNKSDWKLTKIKSHQGKSDYSKLFHFENS